jgi:hypothetical protein
MELLDSDVVLDKSNCSVLDIDELRVGDVPVCIKVDNIDALVIVDELWVAVTLELDIDNPTLPETPVVDVIVSIVALLSSLMLAADWLEYVDPVCVDTVFGVLWDSMVIIVEELDGILVAWLPEEIDETEMGNIEMVDASDAYVELCSVRMLDDDWDEDIELPVIPVIVLSDEVGLPTVKVLDDWLAPAEEEPVIEDEVILWLVSVWK